MNMPITKYSAAATAFRLAALPTNGAALENRIAFLSRQSEEPSLDYRLLAEEFKRRCPDWEVVFSCYRDDGAGLSLSRRAKMSFKQLALARTSRIVVVDGWNPAVSIPSPREGVTVVQLWHALGAIKKFGWQSVGTPMGRTRAQAEGLCMHRNYSFVAASGPGAVHDFALAFDMPQDAIKPLGLPSMDFALSEQGAQERQLKLAELARDIPALAQEGFKVLYAPTFRRGAKLQEELHGHIADLARACEEEQVPLFMVAHPVFAERACASVTLIPGVRSADVFDAFDFIITDYSAVAFEAALFHKMVLFFCPDAKSYDRANGLNLDPTWHFGRVTCKDANDLAQRLAAARACSPEQNAAEYEKCEFWRFADEYMDPRPGSAQRVVEAALQDQAKNSKR